MEPTALLDRIAARLSYPMPEGQFQFSMATLVSPHLAITAQHVLHSLSRDPSTAPVLTLDSPRWSGPSSVRATGVAADPELDYALLRLDSPVPGDFPPTLVSSVLPPAGVPEAD